MDASSLRGKKLVAFDLDDTLAPSKSAMDASMGELLTRLLDRVDVCIISGGRFEQFEQQVLLHLPDPADRSRLHIMPTCGTQYFRWQGDDWVRQYSYELTDDQRSRCRQALEQCARDLGLWEEKTWGPVIEDRGSQMTFSALGQEAPVDAKKAWDPDGSKKEKLRAAVAALVPDLEVRSGGSTSVDVTMQGVDKAFGIGKLCEATGLTLEDIVFVGDRLDEGGNDYPVLAMGVDCLPVSDWKDTLGLVDGLLAGQAFAEA